MPREKTIETFCSSSNIEEGLGLSGVMIHSIFLLLIAGILLQIEIRLFSIFVDCNCKESRNQESRNQNVKYFIVQLQ